MNDEELELKLLKGSTINIDGIKIKPLLLDYIIEDVENGGIGYEKYNNLISIMGIDKSNLTDITSEQLDEIKNFDIFMFNKELMNLLIEFLKIFLNCNNILYLDEQQVIIIDYKTHQAYIHRENYDYIIKIFKKMYCISFGKENEYKAANEQARVLIEKIKKRDEELSKIKAKQAPNIFSIISGVAWKSHNINIFNIFKLTIFQLYDAYYRLDIIDNCQYTMSGIYAGTIDSKNIKQEELTWIKKYSPFS